MTQKKSLMVELIKDPNQVKECIRSSDRTKLTLIFHNGNRMEFHGKELSLKYYLIINGR